MGQFEYHPYDVFGNAAIYDSSESQDVRDLWRQKDLGTFQSSFHSDISFHGAVLIKLTPLCQQQGRF